jgi:uroporphyrinogen decarboxylase
MMNSFERVLNRLHGEPVDRIPNFDIMMQFAAHYIHQPLSSYYQDHRVLCDANLAVADAFDLDIVQAISDPYREAADMGLDVEFPADGLPLRKSALIVEPDDITKVKLPPDGLGKRMTDRVAAVASFRQQVGGAIPIMGWVEGALAEAADVRGVSELLMDMGDTPEWVTELLDRCALVEIAFAQAQIEAGADIIGLGDAIASQISPSAYRRFALPYEQRIFAAVHEMGAFTRLHICGNTTHLLHDMATTGADIIDLDWMVDIGAASAIFGDKLPICGNFDPVAVMLQGTPDDVRRATAECVHRGGPRTISGAGCEIVDGTPAANLHAQAAVLKEQGTAA